MNSGLQDSDVKCSREMDPSFLCAKCSCTAAWGQRIPARYVMLSVIAFKLVLITYVGAMIPLSVVAMVRTQDANTTNSTSDECPEARPPLNATVDPDKQNGEFDWDEMTQSYIYSANPLGMLLCYLPTIRLGEVWGPRLTIGWSMALTTVLGALGPVAARANVWLFISLMFVRGCVAAPITTSFSILLSSWLPANERSRSAGIVFSATILGMLLSMFTAGALLDKYGWTMPSYLSAATSVPFLAMWFYFIYDTPLSHPRISAEERDYIMANTQKDYLDETPPAPWGQMLRSGPVWAFISVQIATGWTGFTLQTELPTYLKDILHFNIQQSSFISALPHMSNLVSNVACSALSQWLRSSHRLGHLTCYKIFNFVATVGSAAGVAVIAELGCRSAAIVAVLVLTMALNGAYFGGSFMNGLELAPNFAGSVTALSSTVTGTVNIVAPTIVGAITNHQQTLLAWRKVFYVCAAMSASPYVVFFFFGSVKEQPWNRIKKAEDEVSIIDAEDGIPIADAPDEC